MKPAITGIALALALTIFCPWATRAGVSEPHIDTLTGTYSNMGYHTETGDVIGDEALVVFSNRGYYVVFQGSEGEPYVPVVVPAKISGSSITFTLPAGTDPRGTFRGELIDDSLTGTFSGNGQTLRLKRKPSYWQ